MRDEINMGACLQRAWQTFLKAPKVFVGILISQILLSVVFKYIPIVGGLLNFLVVTLVVPAIFVVAEQIRREGKASVDELEKITAILPQILVVNLLKTVFLIIGFICLILPGFYLMVAYMYAELFVVVEKKTFWESMEASRALVHRNFFGSLGLLFFCILIALAGLLFLGIGVLVSMPVATLLLHAAFTEIRGQEGAPIAPGV